MVMLNDLYPDEEVRAAYLRYVLAGKKQQDIFAQREGEIIWFDRQGNAPDEMRDQAADCCGLLGKGVLRSVLASMPNLTYLRLRFDENALSHGEFPAPARFGDVVHQDQKWPRLRELRFGGIEADRQELVDFLVRHGVSLTVVKMDFLRLANTSWTHFLPQLRKELDCGKTKVIFDNHIMGISEGGLNTKKQWDVRPYKREIYCYLKYADDRHFHCPLQSNNTDVERWAPGN